MQHTVNFYLILEARKNRYYQVSVKPRITIEKPSLNSNEIAIKLQINVPSEFFERLTPKATLNLPKEAVVNDMNMALEVTGMEVAETLGLQAKEVIDGLKELYANKLNAGKEVKE